LSSVPEKYFKKLVCTPIFIIVITTIFSCVHECFCETIILIVVLYGCETWSLTLREEHRLKVFGSKREGVTGDWIKLNNEELL
jgi:hypothetical protein